MDPNKARVLRLYRKSLKNIMSWCSNRELYYGQVDRVRGLFEAQRHVSDPQLIDELIRRGEEKLESVRHPDPYVVPYYVGGTKYARNPPVPPEMQLVFDYGRET